MDTDDYIFEGNSEENCYLYQMDVKMLLVLRIARLIIEMSLDRIIRGTIPAAGMNFVCTLQC